MLVFSCSENPFIIADIYVLCLLPSLFFTRLCLFLFPEGSLHSPTSMKGGEVVKFQWCAARWHLVPIARWIFKQKIKHSLFFEVPFWQKNWECVLRRYSFRYPIRMKNKVVYLTERRGINKEQVSILGKNVLSTYISYSLSLGDSLRSRTGVLWFDFKSLNLGEVLSYLSWPLLGRKLLLLLLSQRDPK